MPKNESQIVPLAFPVKGIDRSQPNRAQPDLTCAEAVNVRPIDVAAGRMSGGTREGHSKLFTAQAGTGSSRRVNRVVIAPRTVILAPSTAGSRVAVVDGFDGYNTPAAAGYGTYADLRGNYALFRKAPDGAANPFVLGPETGVFRGTVAQNNYAPTGALVLWQTANTTSGNTGLAILYPTTNDINLGLWVDSSVTGVMTGTLSCDGVGPFVRGSNDLKQMIVAYLEYTGQLHTVRLVVDKIDGSTVTRIKTSQKEFQLKGLQNNENARYAYIRLTATATTITAQVNWPDGAVGGVYDTLQITGADGAVWASNNRGGALMRGNAQNTIGGGIGGRWIRKMEYTRVEPYQWPVLTECRAALLTPGTTPNFWLLPTGLSASTHAAGMSNNPAVTAGGATPGTYFGAAQGFPTANTDATVKYIEATAGNSRNLDTRTQLLAVNAAPSGTAQGLDVYYRDIATGRDDLNPVFRLTADHRYMIRVELERDITTENQAYNQTAYTRIRVAAIYNNGGTRTRVQLKEDLFNTSAANGAPIFNIAQNVRFTHVGTTITLYVNGIAAWSYDYSTSGSWAGNVSGTTYGSLMGVDSANASGTTDTQASGFRIVNMTPVTTPSVAEGTDVTIFTPGQVDVGSLETPSAGLTACTGGGLSGAAIEKALLLGKVYATDGSSMIVVDPVQKTVEPYTVGKGVGIDLPTLLCSWRGRLVCAAPANNRPFWIMSRVNDATDMDLGSTAGVSTKAYAGNNAEIGQPAEGIRCLIPFSSDYLIFGCDSSLWVMEGDPGYGGRLQNLSRDTGIVAPRAYCFAEGRVFFMGLGGLFVMNSAREFQQVGPRRLGTILDSVDPSTTLVQMAYDSKDKAVRIFLTPRDGVTIGTQIWYWPELDAFFTDELPLRFGPWAVDQLTGFTEIDRRYVLGGNEGYLYRPDLGATADDGDDISALVRFAPFELSQGTVMTMAKELSAAAAPGSGPVDWSLISAASCQQCEATPLSSARRTGEWFAQGSGYQQPVGLRETAGAHQLVLSKTSSTQRFAIEQITLKVEAVSRRRDTLR